MVSAVTGGNGNGIGKVKNFYGTVTGNGNRKQLLSWFREYVMM